MRKYTVSIARDLSEYTEITVEAENADAVEVLIQAEIDDGRFKRLNNVLAKGKP